MAYTGSATVNISPGTSRSWSGLPDTIRAVLSQEVRLKTQPLLKFGAFAQKKEELGKQPGNSISMLAFGNLPLGGKLSEGIHITPQPLSTQMESVTVYEYGNAVALTEFLARSAWADLISVGSQLLAMDAAKVMDLAMRRALETPKVIVYGGSYASRASLVGNNGTGILTMENIRDAVSQLATAKVPKFVGMGRDCYVCFAHPQVIRTLKKDSAWKSANEYAGSTALFRGEIGRFDDVVFIETTMCPIIKAGSTGTGASSHIYVDGVDVGGSASVATQETDTTGNASYDVYKSYMIGGNSLALATALPVEIREDVVKDFGRERALAWYSIFGTKALDYLSLGAQYQETRYVRLESTAN